MIDFLAESAILLYGSHEQTVDYNVLGGGGGGGG